MVRCWRVRVRRDHDDDDDDDDVVVGFLGEVASSLNLDRNVGIRII